MLLEPRYVESREGDRLLPLQVSGFKPKHLISGDVHLTAVEGKSVGIENKRVYQLLEDMKTGQLMKQMRLLVESYDYPILLVEGSWAHSGKANGYRLHAFPGYTWGEAWNELQTIFSMGISIHLSTSPEHTVDRIIELGEYFSKTSHPSALRGVPGDKRMVALTLIYGVGNVLALKLLAEFGNLARIATASPAQLMECPDVGAKTAKRIYDFFHEEWAAPVATTATTQQENHDATVLQSGMATTP